MGSLPYHYSSFHNKHPPPWNAGGGGMAPACLEECHGGMGPRALTGAQRGGPKGPKGPGPRALAL